MTGGGKSLFPDISLAFKKVPLPHAELTASGNFEDARDALGMA